LRRLYRTFPQGWPGVGLFLLRAVVGVRLIIQGSGGMGNAQVLSLGWFIGLLMLGAGISFLLGFLTPLMACFSVLAGMTLYIWHPNWASSFVNLLSFDRIILLMAIILLGPGAISLDAYFFGRRKIVIPRVARS
jgi:uncharacterized membrane protein YphA (DoxX/SURF4 family)